MLMWLLLLARCQAWRKIAGVDVIDDLVDLRVRPELRYVIEGLEFLSHLLNHEKINLGYSFL